MHIKLAALEVIQEWLSIVICKSFRIIIFYGGGGGSVQ